MDESFTPKNFTHVTFEFSHQKDVRTAAHSKGVNHPSESVIQHLLNYSRALAVIDSKLTGKTNLLLLN